MTERLHFHFSLSCVGEGNGSPLQCSCLENPRDRGSCWLPSMGSHRVRHDWSDLAAAAGSLTCSSSSYVLNPIFSDLSTSFIPQSSLWWERDDLGLARLQARIPRWCSWYPACQCGDIRDTGSIPGLERSPGGGNGNPLQCSCLDNPMDRRAWWAAIHGVTESWTWLKQLSTHSQTSSQHSCDRWQLWWFSSLELQPAK